MKHSVLFLSHDPHEVHAAFARAVGARYLNTGLKGFVACTKRIAWTGHLFAPASFVYSLFINVPEDIILVDGGASLYVALGIKLRRPQKKLIYLDGDTMFYAVRNARPHQQWLAGKLLPHIDAVVSVSELNQSQVTINAPHAVCIPYPKPVCNTGAKRKPYGLYVGRLDPDKNIMNSIEFGLQCPYFEKFVVVGDGVLRKDIEQRAEENPKLQYEGFQKNVAYYYSICSFLIHLPEYDPHPTVTMEAALCGCFPIMSPGTGSNYLFDSIFIIDDTSDFQMIDQRIHHIVNNETAMQQRLHDNVTTFPTDAFAIARFKKTFESLVNTLFV